MSQWVIVWNWEVTEPKKYGEILQIKLNNNNQSILETSLAMKCDNCNQTSDLQVYETHKKWHLFFIIPLGTSDYKYHIYCKNCNAFQLIIKNKDIYNLEKKDILHKNTEY